MGSWCSTPFDDNKDIPVTGAGSQAVKAVPGAWNLISTQHRQLTFDRKGFFTSSKVNIKDEHGNEIMTMKRARTLFDEKGNELCYFRRDTATKFHVCMDETNRVGLQKKSTKLVLATLERNGRSVDVYIHEEPVTGFSKVNIKERTPDIEIASNAIGTEMSFMKGRIKLAEFAKGKLVVGPNMDMALLAILIKAVGELFNDADSSQASTSDMVSDF